MRVKHNRTGFPYLNNQISVVVSMSKGLSFQFPYIKSEIRDPYEMWNVKERGKDKITAALMPYTADGVHNFQSMVRVGRSGY